MQIIAVALGGALGGAARLWVSGFVGRLIGEAFPWGTLAVNVSGAFAVGVLAGIFAAPQAMPDWQLALFGGAVIGVVGSYTTVSSFSLQTLSLLRSGQTRRAIGNIVASVALCLAAVALGLGAAQWLGGA